MADNVVADAGSGGATFATDDVGGVHYPLSKLGFGALDAFTIVTASAGLPVEQQSGSSWTVDNGGTFVVQEDGAALTALQLIDNVVRAEDVASAGGHEGNVILAVRDDILAAGAGVSADGDYTFLRVNNSGALYVAGNGTFTVDLGTNNDVINLGTFAVQEDGAALTALQLIDDTVRAEDVASANAHSGNVILAVRDDALAAGAGVTADGDYTFFRVDNNGALWTVINGTVTVTDDGSFTLGSNSGVDIGDVTINNASGAAAVNIQDGGNVITVDGTVTIGAVTPDLMLGTDFSTVLGTASLILATQADTVANTADGLQSTSFGYYFNGTTWDRARGDATNGLLVNLGTNNDVTVTGTVTVDLGANNDVTNLGTFAVQEDGAALTALQLLDDTVRAEDAASANAHSGNVVLAVRDDALAAGAEVTADGDYTFIRVNNNGALWVAGDGTFTVDGSGVTQPVSGTVTIGAVTPDLMLGTDFSSVLGTASLILGTQADNVVNTSDGLQTTSFGYYFDGTAWDRVRGDAADGLLVNLGTNNDVTITGTVTVDLGANNDVTNLGTFAVQADSVIPGTGATNLGKAEDGAHTTGDVGVMALAVRQSADTPLSGADLDYEPLQTDASGFLKVNIKAGSASGTEYTEDAAAPANPVAPAVSLVRQDTPAGLTTTNGDIVTQRATNFGAAFCQILDSSGNFIDTFGGSGGTSQGDKSAFTEGTTSMTPIGGVFNETISADPTEDQAAAVRITAKRALHVNIRDEADNQAIVPGTNSNHLGKLEDAASTNAATGVAVFAVRDDALAAGAEVSADGDYTFMRVNNNGALWVAMDGTVTVDLGTNNDVTNLGTFAVQVDSLIPGIGATNLGKSEDTPHTTGDVGVMSLAVRNDTLAALAGTDGDYAPLQVNASGALFVDGSGVTQPVSIAGTVTVDLAANNDVTTTGNVAHDGADSGSPVKIGARARSTDITAVATDDRTDLLADLTGKLVTRPHAIPELTVRGVASTTTTTDTSVIAAQGLGVRIYVTSISVANSSTTTGTIVEIKDGTTTIWRTIARAEGGSNLVFDPPLRLTANTALQMAALTGATTVYFSANGYTGV